MNYVSVFSFLSRNGTLSRSLSTRLYSCATGATSQTDIPGTSVSPVSAMSRPNNSPSHTTSSTMESPYTSAPLNALDALDAHTSSSREAGALPSSGTRGFTSLVLLCATTSLASLEINIDLTRAGLVQTTTTSAEIVRGIASGDVECQ
jgi:hypothetical protein